MKRSIALAVLLATTSLLPAGPGHDHHEEPGGGGTHGGPVELTAKQAANLRLETVEAGVVELAPTLEVPAVFVLPPERHARITAPFAGRVTALLAKLGDHVERYQPLLRVTPLAVGSPPQEIRAPLDGVIFEQDAVIGLPFTPETTLMQTGDYRELLARGSFYQSPELTRIQPGQKAVLLLDVFPGERFEGAVQRVDPGHSEGSPFFHIYALVPNANDKLHPNYRDACSSKQARRNPWWPCRGARCSGGWGRGSFTCRPNRCTSSAARCRPGWCPATRWKSSRGCCPATWW